MANESGKKTEGSACGCRDRSCCSGPGKWLWIILAVAGVGLLIAQSAGKKPAAAPSPAVVESEHSAAAAVTQGQALPRLVDLGATQCIPCKRMAPILDDLKRTYVGKMDVQFIDVWENPDAGKEYGINVIPTQIFFDAAGRELFRHEGFFGKEDILAKWKEFGVDLTAAAAEPSLEASSSTSEKAAGSNSQFRTQN